MMLEFFNELQSGNGPVFLKLDHLAEETIGEIEHILHTNERPSRGRFHDKRGNDYRREMVEMHISEIGFCSGHSASGIWTNARGETSVPGLYAAGDCASKVCSNSLCQPASCVDQVKNGAEADVEARMLIEVRNEADTVITFDAVSFLRFAAGQEADDEVLQAVDPGPHVAPAGADDAPDAFLVVARVLLLVASLGERIDALRKQHDELARLLEAAGDQARRLAGAARGHGVDRKLELEQRSHIRTAALQ